MFQTTNQNVVLMDIFSINQIFVVEELHGFVDNAVHQAFNMLVLHGDIDGTWILELDDVQAATSILGIDHGFIMDLRQLNAKEKMMDRPTWKGKSVLHPEFFTQAIIRPVKLGYHYFIPAHYMQS